MKNDSEYKARVESIAERFTHGNKSELSRILDIKPQSLFAYMNGARNPGYTFLSKLSSIGISTDWFLTGTGDMIDINKLKADAPWKRLVTIRHCSQIHNFSTEKWAAGLGVEHEKYLDWEFNRQPIPKPVLSKVAEMVSTHINYDWVMEGKGEMSKDPDFHAISVNDDLISYMPPSAEQEINSAFQYLYDHADMTSKAMIVLLIDNLKLKGVDVQIRRH